METSLLNRSEENIRSYSDECYSDALDDIVCHPILVIRFFLGGFLFFYFFLLYLLLLGWFLLFDLLYLFFFRLGLALVFDLALRSLLLFDSPTSISGAGSGSFETTYNPRSRANLVLHLRAESLCF